MSPFLPEDECRPGQAVSPLPFRAAFIEYRVYMPERTALAALKAHKVACARSYCSVNSLHDQYSACSVAGLPWEPRTHDGHIQELQERLHPVKIQTSADKADLIASLRFNHSHPWGRCTHKNLATRFGLKNGDRLLVGGGLLSIHDLELVVVPCEVWFFRLEKCSGIAGTSLMFNIPGLHDHGIEHFTIDRFVDCTLHTLDLGVTCKWHGLALVELLKHDVYHTELSTQTDRINAGVYSMRKEMKR